jgi:hypothetical protein
MATTTHADQAATTAAAVFSTSSCETSTSNGVSKGALAGAIVASIIGTAILASLAAWLLLGRSKSKRRGFQTYERQDETTAAISKPDPSSSRVLAAKTYNYQSYSDGASENLLLSNSTRRLSKYTLEPADDESVVGRVLGVFDQVSLHVDNYYSHSQPVASPAETASISAFDTPYLPAPLLALLENPKTRRTTITHALVRSLLLAIQPNSGTSGSLLPPLFTPGVRASDGSDDQGTNSCLRHIYPKP